MVNNHVISKEFHGFKYLPPLDDDENDDIQFLRMNTPSWNPKINELRELMQSIRKKEVSMIITTKEG